MNKALLWASIIFVILLILGLSIPTVIAPAHRSYVGACVPSGLEQLEEEGYVVTGSTSQNESGDIKVEVVEREGGTQEEFDSTLKHELCHYNQFLEGRVGTCEGYFPRLITEMECYTAQKLPNEIFNRLYPEQPNLG